MKWRRIAKNPMTYPRAGTYKDWKPELAREAEYQCVYCAIHERSMGGERSFHVEHFRPKKHFPAERDDFGNLFYACPVCNVLKGDTWPGEARDDHSVPAYPDPSRHDYSDILKVSGRTFEVRSAEVAGRFVIESIYLNRPHLLRERRRSALSRRIRGLLAKLELDLENVDPEDAESARLAVALAKSLTRLLAVNEAERVSRPYEPAEIRRPRRAKRNAT